MASGTPLANAFVRIQLDGSGVHSQLNAILRGTNPAPIPINPQLNTQGVIGQLRGLTASIGPALLGGFAAAGVAKVIGSVFTTGIGEQKDFEAGLAKLQVGLKSTGNVAGVTADQMEALATQIQDYSGQTDDSIVATEQLLLTFTNIQNVAGKNNDIFTQTVKIAADMAARLGGDASGAAIQLGKALNDPVKGITALTRVGVSFTEGQKTLIKTLVQSGNTLGAQKIILAELNKEFGGSAEAVGKTLPGEIERAKRSFEDLSQSVVAAVAPLLEQLVPAVKDLINVVGPVLAAAVKGAVTVFKDLVGAGEAIFRFFEHNQALAAALGIVIVGALLPALGALTVAFGTALYSALLTVAIGFANVLVALTSINPVVAGVAVVVGGAIAVFEAFSDHQKTAKLSVDDLTDALVRQSQDGGKAAQDLFIKTLQGTDIGSRGENLLKYLQRYNVDLKGLFKSVKDDDGSFTKYIQKILDDPSVSGKTREKLQNLLIDLSGKFGQATSDATAKLEAQAALDEKAATKSDGLTAALERTAQAQKKVTNAGNDLGKSLSSQIDFFKGVSDASDITGAKLIKNAEDSIKAFADEAVNIDKLRTEHLDPKIIKGLIDQGPQTVAAAASLTQTQIDKYGKLQVQSVQGYEADKLAAVKATEPKLYKALVDAQNASNAIIQRAYVKSLVDPAVDALGQLAVVMSKAGGDIPDNVAARLIDGKQKVVDSLSSTFSDPSKEALAALEKYATDGGTKSATNLAAAIANHTPLVISKQAAMTAGLNTEIRKILDSWGIHITVKDDASDKLKAIAALQSDFLKSFNADPGTVGPAYASLFSASLNAAGNLYEPHNAQIAKAGAMRIWAEPETGGEAYIPLAPGKRDRSLGIWAETGKHLGVPGFADGGITGHITEVLNYDKVLDTLGARISKAISAAQASNVQAGPGQSFSLIIDYMRRSGIGFTQADPGLSRGGHSYHEVGQAVDFSGGNLDAMAAYWHRVKGSLLEEIHSPGYYVKNGKDVGPGFYGPDVVAQHFNHVHIAASLAAMSSLLGLGSTAGLFGAVGAQAGLGGYNTRAFGGTAVFPQYEALANALASARGYSPRQLAELDSIWAQESNFDPAAVNSIGAAGIPQAYGHGNVFPIGRSMEIARLQELWGLNYIDSIGGIDAAYMRKASTGTYDHGGEMPPGLNLNYNGTGRPEMVRTAASEDRILQALNRQNQLLEKILSTHPAATGQAVGAAISNNAQWGHTKAYGRPAGAS